MYDFLFYTFALITVLPAFVVVFARNIAHSAFSLMFTLFGVAGLYVMLGADFVGVSQLLIYVGGILVLFLFGMMLTANIDQLREEQPPMARQLGAVFVGAAMLAMLTMAVWGIPAWRNATPRMLPNDAQTTSTIGTLFMGDFALLFIASSIAILVALVGAAMIARADGFSSEDASTRM
ncbi:MAG TPA: NADH-quinone oxidoreductase subunit J [Candidatus Kapabacteria bacterium]|jgi:NADH-quinone oxidoreductase subunit J|nr:NADH-quinone oxidoreductase subunit J [Candidatus Kapabacteria bacterium]